MQNLLVKINLRIRQIPLQLDNDCKDDISMTGNRSELLRKIIVVYLNEVYIMINKKKLFVINKFQ